MNGDHTAAAFVAAANTGTAFGTAGRIDFTAVDDSCSVICLVAAADACPITAADCFDLAPVESYIAAPGFVAAADALGDVAVEVTAE